MYTCLYIYRSASFGSASVIFYLHHHHLNRHQLLVHMTVVYLACMSLVSHAKLLCNSLACETIPTLVSQFPNTVASVIHI